MGVAGACSRAASGRAGLLRDANAPAAEAQSQIIIIIVVPAKHWSRAASMGQLGAQFIGRANASGAK